MGSFTITPIIPSSAAFDSEATTSTPRPYNPRKKLRSCLSPTRTPTGFMTPARPSSSRTTSFGSECSDVWRRTKSVRWEGENEGCEVTSYHHTWSAEEYDRTPLEPPSADERTCVLPERGSRCILTAFDCFSAGLDQPDHIEEVATDSSTCSSPTEEVSHDSLFLETPDESEGNDEDRQWEECMERRRMMFAMRTTEPVDHQPEFEGYRSISARLVEMLRDIESRRPASPSHEEEEEEEEERGRESGFVFTNLTSLRICEVDHEEEELDDGQTNTPSLISSSESVEDMDSAIVSPRATPSPGIPAGLPSPTKHSRGSDQMGLSPVQEGSEVGLAFR